MPICQSRFIACSWECPYAATGSHNDRT